MPWKWVELARRHSSKGAKEERYVTGYFVGTADFSSTVNLTGNGQTDIFLAKYNSSGNFIWANTIGGTLDDFVYDVAIVPVAGNVIITGTYKSLTMDMDPSTSTNIISNNGNAAFNTENAFIETVRGTRLISSFLTY